MTKFLSALAVTSALTLSTVAAHAHVVTYIVIADNPIDTRPCVFFQVDGGNIWGAIPNDHPEFGYEKALVLSARMTKDPGFDFGLGGPVAASSNIPEAYSIQLHP